MSKLIIALARTVFIVAKAVGIIPFSYSFRRRIASTSYFWRCYTAVLLVAMTVLTPVIISTIYHRTNFLKQQKVLCFVEFSRFVVLHISAIFTVLLQLLKDQNVIYCCNEAIHMFDTLRSLPIDGKRMTLNISLLVQLLVKFMTLWPITLKMGFLITHDRALRDPMFLFSLLSSFYCQLMLIMTFNMFYGATLILTAFRRQLNQHLENIFREIRALKKHPGRANSLKMQKYCEFADVLEKMMNFHLKIVVLGRIFNQQYQVQIVFLLIYVGIECIVQSYTFYSAMTKMKEKGEPARLQPKGIAHILAWLVDLLLVINATEKLAEQSAETKWIVRTSAEVGSVDVRLERTLEQFSIYLYTERVTFTACGLFNVDNRCLFMMWQRLLAFMLILIQFDMILKQKKLHV